MRIEELHNV